MHSNIHVLIAHDCLFAAECLSIGLKTDPHVSVVDISEEADVIATAVRQPQASILIYLTSPWPAPLRLADKIHAQLPGAKIIVLGVPPGENFIIDCIKAGAKGWLHKSSPLQEIHRTLQTVNEGKFLYSPRLANNMFRSLCQLSANRPLIESIGPATLTAREVQVMELLAEGKGNQQIATALHLSVHTVKKHVHTLLAKLQIRNRTQLAQTVNFLKEPCE